MIYNNAENETSETDNNLANNQLPIDQLVDDPQQIKLQLRNPETFSNQTTVIQSKILQVPPIKIRSNYNSNLLQPSTTRET